MKTKLWIEIDCKEIHCGDCRFVVENPVYEGKAYCELFQSDNEYNLRKAKGTFKRLPICLDRQVSKLIPLKATIRKAYKDVMEYIKIHRRFDIVFVPTMYNNNIGSIYAMSFKYAGAFYVNHDTPYKEFKAEYLKGI